MKFSGIVYIRVYTNSFRFKIIGEHQEIETSAQEPFTSQRLLIGEFKVAEKYLKQGIKKAYGNRLIKPIIVIHPMEKSDGGLSEVEERVLKDLAKNTGARKVYIWVGPELSDSEILNKIDKKKFV